MLDNQLIRIYFGLVDAYQGRITIRWLAESLRRGCSSPYSASDTLYFIYMRVFFSGIGGVGIGPLALIARDMGHEVIGSDASASRYTDLMQEQGVTVYIPQAADNVEKSHEQGRLDWFVYTAALPADHPELKAAKKLGIKVSKRDEFLNELIKSKNLRLITATGTHGKTTTTGMLIWLFKQLGQPLSYSVGTNLSFGPSGQYQDGSQYFIYEGDEYDRNFLQFAPYASVVASVDYDHSDTYPKPEDYLDAFRQFISQSHCAFLWSKDAETIGGLPDGAVHVYGADEDLSKYKLLGHNQRNAFLAVQCVHSLFPNKTVDELIGMVNDFPGTERRFEKLKDNLYTDYAHHPAEITSTIDMAREVNKNVVVVYQPHQNLRQVELNKVKAYESAFLGAKQVYWLPTYLSREPKDLKILGPDKLIKNIKHKHIETMDMDDSLIGTIRRHMSQGDLVLIMGAGDVDAWARQNL